MSEIIQAGTVGEALETAASKRPGSPHVLLRGQGVFLFRS